MKYLVLIGDGMSDLPVKELKGKTPLEVAKTPNMDYLARNGLCGWTLNVPKGMPPGSDVAAVSIFGYDPAKHYTGRGPLEAASLGVKLKKGDVAFRLNLVTIRDGKMEDFTAGHISTEEARKIIRSLDQKLGNKDVKLLPGLSYRHLLVVSRVMNSLSNVKCTPPHDITGKEAERYLPHGPGASLLTYIMKEAIMPLLEHPVNLKRVKSGKKPANLIWPWGGGKTPDMLSFKKKYKRSAAVITAVHLLKGLGKILGMKVIEVPGATGFLDTNYKGKAEYALRALKKHDLVLVHVEAPDEAGHMGDVKGKIRAIEDFDRLVVGTILKKIRLTGYPDIRILLLPDHPTPIVKMTHTGDPVPFVLYDSNKPLDSKIKGFNEKEFKKAKLFIRDGSKLMGKLLSRG